MSETGPRPGDCGFRGNGDCCRLAQIEREMREQRNFLASVIEYAQTMIVVLNARYQVESANPFALSLLGTPSEKDILNVSWLRLVPPDGRQTLFHLLRQALQGIAGNGTITKLQTLTGQTKYISWHVSPLTTETEVRCLVVGHDVTEQVQLGNLLKEANRRLQKATLAATEIM